jgi:thymidylate kinase
MASLGAASNAVASSERERLITAAHSRLKDDIKLKIVILGPDGAGKSSVIQGLIGILNHGGRTVKMRHLKPRLVLRRPGEQVTIVVDPHGKPERSALVSLAKIWVWLMEEWYASLFQDRKETLLICDRYYHDLLIDPMRYRYGGPAWAARLIGKLMPQPNLWILLDAPAEVLQARKQEVPLEETSRQRNAYLAFVQGQRNFVIVDAAQSLDRVITDVERAVATAVARGKRNHG